MKKDVVITAQAILDKLSEIFKSVKANDAGEVYQKLKSYIISTFLENA